MADIGVRIAVDGEAAFKKALGDIIAESKMLDSEMKLVSSSFDKNASASKKAAGEQKVLTKQIENQKQKVAMLKQGVTDMAEKYGDADRRVIKMKTDLNNAETALNKMSQEAKENGNVFTRFGAKIKEAFSGLKDSEKKAISFGDVLKANILGDLISSGLKQAGSALVDFGKQAVNSFAELEQNIGGSEAVFGEYAGELQKTAEDAYKTMGTTQSDYLATANKMGALFQGSGLDAERSMELTTQAMQRAADMASVMGIDTESALEAVTGAAKGNYTMMDNLGVAMNATTLDAYAMAKGYDTAFSKMSNADKAEVAMAYFFEQTSQYAGNFEREATQTIAGSLGMLQSAWQTLVAGVANGNADITNLVNNLFDSIGAVSQNILPVVETIGQNLPAIITTMVDGFTAALPQIMSAGGTILNGLVQGLMVALPALIDGAAMMISTLANGMTGNMDQIIATAGQLIQTVGSAIIRNLPTIIASGVQLIGALVTGLLNAIPKVVAAIPRIVSSIRQSFSAINWGDIGRNIIQGIANGLANAAGAIVDAAKAAANKALEAAKNFLGIHSPSKVFKMEVGRMMALGMGEGFAEYTPTKQIQAAVDASIPSVGNSTSVSYGGTNINIYAQPGQSVRAIANEVAKVLNNQVDQRINAWATV